MKKSIFGILFVFVLVSSIIPSVFADSYVTITQTSGQTTNPVAIQNTAGTNLYIIDTSGNQNFLGTNVAKFSNCGIVLRNTASTFATTICGGAVTQNRTLNIPVITGTDTLATLGLGETFSGTQTFSGGITMSGSNIALGGNQITTSSFTASEVSVGGTPRIGVTPTSGNNPFYSWFYPSGTNNQALSMWSAQNSLVNAAILDVGANSATELVIKSDKIGTGTVLPINMYMLTTPVFGIDTSNNAGVYATKKFCLDFSSSACGNNYIYQSSANVIDLFAGGVNTFRSTSSAITSYVPTTITVAGNSGLSLTSTNTIGPSISLGGGTAWAIRSTNTGDPEGANDLIITNVGGSYRAMLIDPSANVAIGKAGALTTTATDGFLYIPTSAGVPTGVPTAFTGKVAIQYDTTDNKIYIYNGGWKAILLS